MQAERLSLSLREELNLSSVQKLPPRKFLLSKGIIVWEPSKIPGLNPRHVKQLTQVDPDSWSGCTVKENGLTAIIINPAHPKTRQANLSLIHI